MKRNCIKCKKTIAEEGKIYIAGTICHGHKKDVIKYNIILNLIAIGICIIAIFALSTQAHAASWDTAGNNVTTNDRIGTTNFLPFKIMTNNVDRISINVDGLRFLTPLFYITNSNGQFVMGHNSATGCTTLFGQVSNMINMCNNRVEILGAPLVAKTPYYIMTTPTYTATVNDYTIECTPGGFVYLPPVANLTGKHYEVINPYPQVCTVFANGLELIGNQIPEPKYKILEWESVTLVGNGNVWRVIK